MSTSFLVTTGLLPGHNYQFIVRAKNAYGFGQFSNPARIRSSDRPTTMVSAVTTI